VLSRSDDGNSISTVRPLQSNCSRCSNAGVTDRACGKPLRSTYSENSMRRTSVSVGTFTVSRTGRVSTTEGGVVSRGPPLGACGLAQETRRRAATPRRPHAHIGGRCPLGRSRLPGSESAWRRGNTEIPVREETSKHPVNHVPLSGGITSAWKPGIILRFQRAFVLSGRVWIGGRMGKHCVLHTFIRAYAYISCE
jgi:hypothetical protein